MKKFFQLRVPINIPKIFYLLLNVLCLEIFVILLSRTFFLVHLCNPNLVDVFPVFKKIFFLITEIYY